MTASAAADADQIRIGISACLMGEEVRFDGQHKLDRFLRDTVGQFVRFVTVCPEVEVGMGIPRETIRLQADGDDPQAIRLIAPKSGKDHTRAMARYAQQRVRALAGADLDGFVVKKGSPSCGMERVPIHRSAGGPPRRKGRGLFTRELMDSLPLLPVEEEGRLHDPRLRENFFERVFAHRRLKQLFGRRWTRGALVRLHTAEKMLLLAHHRPGYEELGRLVASLKGRSPSEVSQTYQRLFMAALSRIATTRKHTNVLQHMAGHLKRLLDASDREELGALIDDFHRGLTPLIVPLTLIRHHVRRHGVTYLAQQTYLEPHPKELMLRNHV